MSTIKTVLPHQLAWLRRTDLEEKNDLTVFEVWELPNGELYYHSKFNGPLRLPVVPRRAETFKPGESA